MAAAVTVSNAGFTLLELLLVLSIIGIIIVLTASGYNQLVQSSRVREAATFVSQRLASAQANSKLQNKEWVFQVKDKNTFQTGPTGTLTDVPLPSGIEFDSTTVTALPIVKFDPPYGARSDYQTNGTGVSSFKLVSSANAAKTRTVKIVSLLGQVVVQ